MDNNVNGARYKKCPKCKTINSLYGQKCESCGADIKNARIYGGLAFAGFNKVSIINIVGAVVMCVLFFFPFVAQSLGGILIFSMSCWDLATDSNIGRPIIFLLLGSHVLLLFVTIVKRNYTGYNVLRNISVVGLGVTIVCMLVVVDMLGGFDVFSHILPLFSLWTWVTLVIYALLVVYNYKNMA